MLLNDTGEIIDDRWRWLAEQYQYVNLDSYVIMPNHIHGIISINKPVGTGHDRPLHG